jgi:hypothetical protein
MKNARARSERDTFAMRAAKHLLSIRDVKIAALLLYVAVLTVGGAAVGCTVGQGPQSRGSHESVTVAATSEGSSVTIPVGSLSSTFPTDSPSTISRNSAGPSPTAVLGGLVSEPTMARVFADIARIMAPAPVYGLIEMPPDSAMPAAWWPVLSMTAPAGYEGPTIPNPRVTGEVQDNKEVQLVLSAGGGWLAFLENFRGDLGDVAGDPVGEVAGHPAILYSVNGGTLVQWSDRGAWYGVFGRGLRSAEVVRIALAMTLIDPSH